MNLLKEYYSLDGLILTFALGQVCLEPYISSQVIHIGSFSVMF
jgi:hypothetical protein